MGRHGASFIAARRDPSAEVTPGGAAKYVGRVGALALALGVGAAVVGGAGLASADDSTGGGPRDGGAQASSDPGPTADRAVGPQTSTGGTATAKGDEPTSRDVPKMVVDGGVETSRQGATRAAPDSLPTLLAKIPSQLVAAFTNGVTGASATTRPHTATTAPSGSRGSSRPDSEARRAVPRTADDDPVTTDGAVTVHPGTTPVDDGPSITTEPVAQPVRQRLTASSTVATTSASEVDLAAAAPSVTVAPSPANPIATVVSGILGALGFSQASATPGGTPHAPVPILLAALQLIHREIERFTTNLVSAAAFYSSAQVHVPPATAATAPAPTDETPSAYGDIGKWMLESSGQISDYGGQPYGGRTLLEPVNVIIVDPTSTSSAEATAKLNAAMFWSGFPAQPIHSTGFQGTIDDVTYGQQPSGLLLGYSDNLFVFPNDHGRIFGPDPVQTSAGYVWSGAFSTEVLTIYGFLPAHAYVSSDMARTALATRLILSGQATYVGMVPLDNAYDTATTTTGDHDGYAVVLRLR